MVFENGVKNIQAAAYNGARTVDDVGGDGVFILKNIQKLAGFHFSVKMNCI